MELIGDPFKPLEPYIFATAFALARMLAMMAVFPVFDRLGDHYVKNFDVQPPVHIRDKRYTVLVPTVDADGNDVGGIQSTTRQVPLGTYTGWNFYRAPYVEGELCDRDGTYIPFAATAADRAAKGDPRPSLEERYGTHAAYVQKMTQAAAQLVSERMLLQEDAEKALYAATQQIAPQAGSQFEAGDFTASLQTLAALREPVDAFFDGVMVNAEQTDLRLNRQGLLKTLHDAMNRVADLLERQNQLLASIAKDGSKTATTLVRVTRDGNALLTEPA